MLSTTTANRIMLHDIERQETGSRSFIVWACPSLIAKSMTSQSGYSTLRPLSQPSRSTLLYRQLRMLKSLFKDIEHRTLTTSIIAKTLISMSPVAQELFKDTFIALGFVGAP